MKSRASRCQAGVRSTLWLPISSSLTSVSYTHLDVYKRQTVAWPHVARHVAEAVAAGAADEGILFCWTGTGVTIAANKVPGIRAALCSDAETARGARLWNNANVLCLSLRRTSEVIAREILDAWFSTRYNPNETDDACLTAVDAIEADYAG